ncbi:MAG: hypothetical protein WAP37_09545, partial [Solirubrobacterales bacterium]
MQREARPRPSLAVWAVGAVATALFVLLNLLSEQARAVGGPGILSFEFVGTAERAARFMAEWGGDGQRSIELSLWIDFGFIVIYATWFTMLMRIGVRRLTAAGAAERA